MRARGATSHRQSCPASPSRALLHLTGLFDECARRLGRYWKEEWTWVIHASGLDTEVVALPRFRADGHCSFVLPGFSPDSDDVIARRDLDDYVLVCADPIQQDAIQHDAKICATSKKTKFADDDDLRSLIWVG